MNPCGHAEIEVGGMNEEVVREPRVAPLCEAARSILERTRAQEESGHP